MKTPRFSDLCARISAELMAVENERWQARLEDPQYRAFLAEHFRMALTETNAVEDDSAARAGQNDPAVSVTDSLFLGREQRFPNNVGPKGLRPTSTS